MQVSVDRQHRVVRAGLLGFVGHGVAVASRAPAAPWCPTAISTLPCGRPGWHHPARRPPPSTTPRGRRKHRRDPPALDRLLADDALAGRCARHRGGRSRPHRRRTLRRRIFRRHAAARLVDDQERPRRHGRRARQTRPPESGSIGWMAATGDGREHIRIADLLAMSSGLRFNEAYGASPMSRACCTAAGHGRVRARATPGASGRQVLELFERHRQHPVAHRAGRRGIARRRIPAEILFKRSA